MTPNEDAAIRDLLTEIDRERHVAECPCTRVLLRILSDGLGKLAAAGRKDPGIAAQGDARCPCK